MPVEERLDRRPVATAELRIYPWQAVPLQNMRESKPHTSAALAEYAVGNLVLVREKTGRLGRAGNSGAYRRLFWLRTVHHPHGTQCSIRVAWTSLRGVVTHCKTTGRVAVEGNPLQGTTGTKKPAKPLT